MLRPYSQRDTNSAECEKYLILLIFYLCFFLPWFLCQLFTFSYLQLKTSGQ
jgi:hypothetical protein